MNETATYAFAAFVLPPTSLGLLALIGLFVMRRRARLGLSFVALSAVALLLLSMPAIAMALLRTLEPPPLDITAARNGKPQAIVILAGGRQRGAPEWGGETVNHFTMQRLRYGALLARELALPILVSGGAPGPGIRTEAVLMRDVLVDELRTEVRWIEDASPTTRENARLSALMLRAVDASRIVLVTDAAHMPRAAANFSDHGFTVTRAPTGYLGQLPFAWNHLLPSVEGLRRTNIALLEWMAIVRDQLVS
jgi:uncharacterized SAM-binding protein YcdF (DUF218 family)